MENNQAIPPVPSFRKNIPLTNSDIGNAFIALNKENTILYDYAKTFYWTLLKYFGAYSALNSGIISGNASKTAASYNSIVSSGINAIQWLANNVITNLPVVGTIVGYIDTIVDTIFSEQNSRKLENRVTAINKIITYNKDPNAQIEENFNLCLALAAI